jgi:hypothetical protein
MIEWLQTAPVWWANALTQVLFVLIALAVFAVPKRVFMEDAPDQSHWRDIRLWAVALVVVQLGIYALFS